jgi:rubrerythrin
MDVDPRGTSMKRFADLSEQEVLALAISNEEEDSRIYRDFAEGLRPGFPDTAKMFEEMAAEEVHHRGLLYDLYRAKFGEHMPLVRRQDVRVFMRHKPVWLVRPLGLDEVRKYAAAMEYETARFYRKAAESAHDASVRNTRTSPKISASACSPRMSAPARTRPRGGCSCCSMCNPASPA